MKKFLNLEDMAETLQTIYKDSLEDEQAARHESLIEEYAWLNAESFVNDMQVYAHRKDTHMSGNFCNIIQDWEFTREFIGSEVQPWGKFSDIVQSMDDETISDEDLAKVQQWCKDWFFTAFGTWGLIYNFHNFIAEIEYEEEEDAA